MITMENVLRLMAEKSASDLYLSANAPILLKVNGQLMPVTDHVLAPTVPRQLLTEILTPIQLEELEQDRTSRELLTTPVSFRRPGR